MGFSIDDLDIQLLQAAAQMASFLMALLWWRYLWPRSFMARWQGERPLGGEQMLHGSASFALS